MNNLFNQLNNIPQRNPSFLNKLKAIKNPQALLQNVIQQNPQIQVMLNAYNGDMEKTFYALAKQKGVNPQDVLNSLK